MSRNAENLYVALCNSGTSNSSDYMTFGAGEILIITDKSDWNWWRARSIDGRRWGKVLRRHLISQEENNIQQSSRWYCKDFDREKSERALLQLSDDDGQGAFLVRPAKEFFILSFRDGYVVHHYQIKKWPNGELSLGSRDKFSSLVELICHYQHISANFLKKPVNQSELSLKLNDCLIGGTSSRSSGATSGSERRNTRKLYLNTEGGNITEREHVQGNSFILIAPDQHARRQTSSGSSSSEILESASPRKEPVLSPGDTRVNTQGGMATLNHVIDGNSVIYHGMPSEWVMAELLQQSDQQTSLSRSRRTPSPVEEEHVDQDDDTIVHVSTGGGAYIKKQTVRGNQVIHHAPVRKRL